MMETEVLSKDVGTILVGEEAVQEGIITHVGGIKEAIERLHELIEMEKEMEKEKKVTT